jgi:hypothetical protein
MNPVSRPVCVLSRGEGACRCRAWASARPGHDLAVRSWLIRMNVRSVRLYQPSHSGAAQKANSGLAV